MHTDVYRPLGLAWGRRGAAGLQGAPGSGRPAGGAGERPACRGRRGAAGLQGAPGSGRLHSAGSRAARRGAGPGGQDMAAHGPAVGSSSFQPANHISSNRASNLKVDV
ncbi:hypothetical protein EYF80_055829 [Liparis tanakae]|uniref:Uncharacterized protein n=1 Tax=Liparis tanakae TaxID=230148 RepID=A0A4Z2EYF2_9TELE|nr:hypothetical protein EYF80_055829 [Liparis tanakae]